jgi:hypothetical protein
VVILISSKVKFWTFFWDLGVLILTIIIMLLLALIPEFNKIYIFVIPGITFIALGTNLIVSTILKKPHVYCLYQKQRRQTVTYYPYHMDWKNNFNKKEMISNGIIFIFIGLMFVIGFIAIYMYG